VKAIPPAMGPGYASATKMIAPGRMKTHASEIRECSLPPSQTASWLRPRSCRRRFDVGERIIIGDSRGKLLATDITGKQPLYIGKAGEIAQRISPSPGSAVSFVTSAHDDTRLRISPQPPTRAFILTLKDDVVNAKRCATCPIRQRWRDGS
jgi:hypothetical protein